jgi:crotonobetainyl-CoA:carnitine CoA-transferase CaiB-like acyl-CoA transferase
MKLAILDFSHALAGPYCTLLLADYGATVYKLEAPGGSDMGRGWGPPFIEGQAAFFRGLNRGKQGVSIDLKQPEGVELCLRLIEKMDVLVENFRPGTMERLGLGYPVARTRNPGLVYCSISGYGQTGPSRDEAAMDLIVQASSGLISITGTEMGEQVRCGYSVADVTAGLFAVIRILMALRERDVTGEGQYLDIAMQDCLISTMASNYMTYLGSGVAPKPMGTGFATVAPYRVFRGGDGRGFAIAVGSEKLWSAFCVAIGHPEFELRAEFATNADRCSNRQALDAELASVFAGEDAARWVERLRGAGIPCTPVRDFEEVAESSSMFPAVAGHRVVGVPGGSPTTGAPQPGEHTESVLTELLGLDAAVLPDLERRGIVDAGLKLTKSAIR